MVTTLTHPDLVRSLVVVDIAPKDYGDLDRFVHYIEAMRALPLDELTGRADAEQRFAAVEPDPGVRGFLLQNLRRHGTTWSWQANLELLARDAARGTDSQIADFPEPGVPAYDGPVVWLVGGDSSYVKDADTAQMRALFPGPGRSSSTAWATGCTRRRPRWSPRHCAGCCASCPPD